VSDALQAFQWAINQHQANGTPQVLTNSWGMFQKAWDPDYCTNANHPFTRKVVEALDEGILVLFAAGNCGGTCPDGRCATDTGPGKSIWGANSHPRVITVGAVNKNEQFVGYSSQGPGALDANKPDFCSITHFTGYFTSDSGTSAATPIAAGVVALLKQAKPALTQDQVKAALKSTAKDIGPVGFDQHSGAGIIRAKAAYDALAQPATWKGWENLGGFCTDGVGVSSWAANRLDTFVVGNDRQLWHKWFSGGWSGWEPLGGNLYSNPAAVSWGPNRIDVFGIGGNRAMWHKWFS
jgi:subtilisin family serine protease